MRGSHAADGYACRVDAPVDDALRGCERSGAPARAASPEAAREPARRDVWSPERRRLDEPLAAMRRVGGRSGQERAPL
ncbi:hypothetical protein EMIHUDRAFT_373576, partial [Emiliania huxleyi CCMP1516]|uniref:Uncharacterized protein n=2 Tax=Emiliania huxleyi TaxID=2903 RepID=A0A0D3JW54_EMIH1